jgi:hypothetical protein
MLPLDKCFVTSLCFALLLCLSTLLLTFFLAAHDVIRLTGPNGGFVNTVKTFGIS